jgi:CheY-like chemotaxis protein
MNVPKRRVLVVDDEQIVCDSVEMMLSFDGHSVRTATRGAEALARLDQEPFDLILIDYAMPEMKGDELARRIKQRYPALPIVMITAHAELLESTGVPLPGVAMIISKPFMLEALREAVAKCCPAPAGGSSAG